MLQLIFQVLSCYIFLFIYLVASPGVHYIDGSVFNIFGRLLYVFIWVIPQRLNFICRRIGTLCLFHLHRRVGMKNDWVENVGVFIQDINTPKRLHIKFRCRGITQKKTFNIQNTAKVWNPECLEEPSLSAFSNYLTIVLWWKGCQRKWLWVVFRYCLRMCLEKYSTIPL
jgi:hypothetical protein